MSELIQAPPAPIETPAVPGTTGQSATAGNVTADPVQRAVDAKMSSTDKIPSPPELYEVKVNGQVRKYTLEQLKTHANLGIAANEKFQTAAQKEKRLEEIQSRFNDDPFEGTIEILKLKGFSQQEAESKARQMFEKKYKERYIDPEMMTEEQRKIADLEKRIAESDNEKKTRADKERAEQEQQEQARTVESVQKDIIDTLESSNLPKTRFYANRVAFWMKQNLSKGYDAPREVIVQQVKDEEQSIVASIVEHATPEQLVRVLGEGAIKKLRQYDIAQLKSRFENKQTTQQPPQNTTRGGGGKTMADVDDYMNSLRRSRK